METKLLHEANEYLYELKQSDNYHSERMKELDQYADCLLKRRKAEGNGWYYTVRKKGESSFCYLGPDYNKEVKAIKEYRFHKLSRLHIAENIKYVESMISSLYKTGKEGVNSDLPELYRLDEIETSHGIESEKRIWKEEAESIKNRFPVYHPEELNIKTDDGTMVRSKSEALIYNYLLQMGVTFAYELPLKIGNRYYYPDFTILSEIDYKTEVLIEHQGLMGNETYRERFTEKMYGYLREGYVQGITIFYTFDQLDGGFDKSPIVDIIRKIRMD